MKKLNTTTLSIAGVLLLVLALLSLATPLVRVSNGINGGGFSRQLNGQGFPGGENNFQPNQAFPGQENPGNQGGMPLPGQGQRSSGQDSQNLPIRQGAGGLLRFGLLRGIAGTVVFGLALVISIAAALGMFLGKRWGQVIGIGMAVIHLVLAGLAFLPQILFSFMGRFNLLGIGLDVLRLLLAAAVIILALIPAKKGGVGTGLETNTPTAPAG